MASNEGGGPSGSTYDVFLSFRGPDTRNGFVDYLYEDMTDAGIRVFVDNERLHVGDVIGEELMRAIDDSKICMPVFSKSYASSKWCLRELEHMMIDRIGHEVMPIFFNVTPDDVKLQTELYSDDLKKLEIEHGSEAADRWRNCLKEVCKIKGLNLEESKGQEKLIKNIVREVLHKTKKRYMNVSDHIVGIEGQVEAIRKLLEDPIDCVRFVVIHGMGGIGKTTLAKVIFNEVSSKFRGCSFLSNVRESSIVKLQEQIINEILRTSVSIYNMDDGINEIRERCSNKKVLLILDDVDDRDQIGKLAGKFDWFGRGSRIIVTTRDISIIPIGLLSYDAQRKNNKQEIEGEDNPGDICYYEMRVMDHQHATTLFKRHAFGLDENSFDDDKLLQEIVILIDGLPLALEVVGSHLFGQTEAVWRETLKKLKRAPHKKVQNALMISYESLEDEEKEIFLDIACYFQGIRKRFPMFVWESIDLCPESGMNALLHKCLIKIDYEDRILMHDQLRDLGREIVRRDGKSSRIWIHEEAIRMILDEKGTRDVVLLDLGELSECYKFEKAGFENLVNLRVLKLCRGSFTGDFSNCFQQLRWFVWTSFPSNFKAQNFSLPNLIALRLENTDIDERWSGWNGLLGSKLKVLELVGCNGLTRTSDFSACLGLERLVLHHCNRLTEIDSSIGKLHELTHLEILGSPELKGLPQSLASLKRMEKLILTGLLGVKYPVKFDLPLGFENWKSLCHVAIENVGLESLPNGIGQLKLLKYLSFSGCHLLKSLSESLWELESLVELNLRSSGLMGLSGRIKNMKELKVLNLSYTNIRILPKSIGCLAKLEELDVSFCRSLEQIPSEIERLFSLRILKLGTTSVVELPSTIGRLSRLQRLDMYPCSKLRRVEHLPASLSHLELPYFSLQVIPDLSKLVNLVDLTLYSNEATFFYEGPPIKNDEQVNVDRQTSIRSLDFTWIEKLHQLKRLQMGVPIDIFNSLQVDFRSLSTAEWVISCSDTQSLSLLPPNLWALIVTKFKDTTLQLLPYPNLKNLSTLFIDNLLSEEIELRGLEFLGNLRRFEVWDCQSLLRLSISSCPKKLDLLNIIKCPKLVEVQGLDKFESLHTLGFFECPSLARISDLSNLVMIKHLKIVYCHYMESIPALPRMECPFDVEIINSGKLPDFFGPHDLYRGWR